jgi:hypothetical protein
MQRKLTILAILLAVGAIFPAGGSTFVAMSEKARVAASDAVVRGQVVSVGSGLQANVNCTPYGYLCDPRYVSGVVCCPGTSCRSPYPGVPQYCL